MGFRREGRPSGGRLDDEVRARFMAELRLGATPAVAARAARVSKSTGIRWLREAGGMPRTENPELEAAARVGTGRLSFVDRCRIEELVRARYRPARIAALLGRARSTITRELVRGHDARLNRYRAVAGQRRADQAGARPKQRLLDARPRLRAEVVEGLRRRRSPQQIAGRLRRDHPDDPEMRVSHETIYQALYVQPRGGLAREVRAAIGEGRALRSGRSRRRPQGRSHGGGPIAGMINISERPAEAADRAVPGHWEGDLIIGAHGRSAIGTLVERTTGYVVLLHLPGDHTAATVADAMRRAVPQIPEQLRRSLTWDRGSEMAKHAEITTATGLPIYFADPRSPWQRGSNENTNGLLRQYFPKGTDLAQWGSGHLDDVAAELNDRPRRRHDYETPAERLNQLLSHQQTCCTDP